MWSFFRRTFRSGEGQSLLETALLAPVVLIALLNAVNIGYFFFTYLNLATVVRQGAEYSIQGIETMQGDNLPTADQIQALVNETITTAIPGAANTPTRICTQSVGLSNAGTSQQVPLCNTYGNGTGNFSNLQPDPGGQ